MKKLLPILMISFLVISCGEKGKQESKGFEVNRKKTANSEAGAAQEVPVDMNNKGIGPISSYSFSSDINTEMADAGKSIYNSKCTACHMAEMRMIGPALKGVYERRSPEWVLNLLLNPMEMLKEDPIAKALLKEYNNAIMTNSNLSEEEAKQVAEYLRTL